MDLSLPQTPGVSFRIAGFPVRVDLMFGLTAVLLGMGLSDPLLQVLWVGVVFVSVLWHELGHAVAFRRFGIPARIDLIAFGGVTTPLAGGTLSPRRAIAVSLAGPFAGFALAGVVAVAGPRLVAPMGPGQFVVTAGIWANLVWGLVNLLPMLPLDGGRVMAAVVHWVTRGRTQRPALVISAVTAGVVATVAARAGQWFAAVIIGLMGLSSLRALGVLPRRRGGLSAADQRLERADRELRHGDVGAASQIAEELLAAPPSPAVHVAAAKLHMWTCLLQGHLQQAVTTMESAPSDHGAAPVITDGATVAAGGPEAAVALLRAAFDARPGDVSGLQLARGLLQVGEVDEAVCLAETMRAGANTAAVVGRALFRMERYAEAAQVGERSFDHNAHPVTAFNVACAWARAGRVDNAVSWLGRAVEAGFDSLAELDASPHLAAVRDQPSYDLIRRQLGAV